MPRFVLPTQKTDPNLIHDVLSTGFKGLIFLLFRNLADTDKVDDEGSFIRFFRGLPVRDDEIIRVFDRGDWYTAHGDDAAFIARTVSQAMNPWNVGSNLALGI